MCIIHFDEIIILTYIYHKIFIIMSTTFRREYDYINT